MTSHRQSDRNEMRISGLAASPGIAIGHAFVLDEDAVDIVEISVNPAQLEDEIDRFEDALAKTRIQIKEIRNRIAESLGDSEAEIFDAHLLVLEDNALIDETITEIKTAFINAESAFNKVCTKYIAFFNNMEDEYLRERVVDIKDVFRRVVSNMLGKEETPLAEFTRNHILIATEITPSQTLDLQRDDVLGFVTELGTRTSHSSIMARTMQVPAVVGLREITDLIKQDELVIVDGHDGIIIIRPTAETIRDYANRQQAQLEIFETFKKSIRLPAQTIDGVTLEIKANIEGLESIPSVLKNKADGIGLYRTEAFFIKHGDYPSEEEQFLEYKSILESIPDQEVIIRTLDIGGDKILNASTEHNLEANPFMGFRGIRFCLGNPKIFKEQIKAILRASVFGKPKIMLPMISGEEELVEAKAIIRQCKEELKQANIPYLDELPIGIMVEVPSIVFSLDTIAEHCDFLSIGSNDLIQYLFAADRCNELVAHLYQPASPTLVIVLKQIADIAKKHKIPVGICGELAGDPIFTPLLFGLGIDSLSMAPSALPEIRYLIQHFSVAETQELANEILSNRRTSENVNALKSFYSQKLQEAIQ